MRAFTGRLVVLSLVAAALVHAPASAATRVWNRFFDGPLQGTDIGGRVAVAADGSIYVVGAVSNSSRDIYVRKMTPGGRKVWERIYDEAGMEDQAYGVAVARDGSVYVAGYVTVAPSNRDLWLARYTAGGMLKWKVTLDAGAGKADEGHAVTVGSDGAVYVAGKGQESSATTAAILLARYCSHGLLEWSTSFSSRSTAWGIAPAPGGGVYVAGQGLAGFESTTWNDIGVWRVDAGGTVLWDQFITSDGGYDEQAWDVAAAPGGGLYVAGVIRTTTEGMDIWVGRLDAEGNVVKATLHDESGTYDSANAIAIDSLGGVWVAGSVMVEAGHHNAWLGHVNNRGRLTWETNWDGGVRGLDLATGVAAARDGSIYVCGSVTREGSADIFLRKYR